MNDYNGKMMVFAFIMTIYIIIGVLVTSWMDRKYYDKKKKEKDTDNSHAVFRCFLWPAFLPIELLRLRKGPTVQPKEGVSSMDTSDYKCNSNMISVIIPDTVTELKRDAFQDCFKLQHVFIPNTVTRIAPCIFSYCEELSSVEVASDNPIYKMLGGHLVEKESGRLVISTAANTIIPKGVTEIGPKAFACRDDVEEIVIPYTVTKIGEGAFEACQNLSSLVIPESVTEIGAHAFFECYSLGEVHLPASLRKLGYAFDGEYRYGIDIYCHMANPAQCEMDGDFTEWPPNSYSTLYVPKGTKDKYETAEPWCWFETIKEID